MPSPYANPYGSLTKVDVKGPSAKEQEQAKRNAGTADLMRTIGSWAPVVGGGLGGLVGGLATGGAGIVPGMAAGAGLGQLAGAGLGAAADGQTRGDEEADLSRRKKLEALQQMAFLAR
jgi:hypothetical protein